MRRFITFTPNMQRWSKAAPSFPHPSVFMVSPCDIADITLHIWCVCACAWSPSHVYPRAMCVSVKCVQPVDRPQCPPPPTVSFSLCLSQVLIFWGSSQSAHSSHSSSMTRARNEAWNRALAETVAGSWGFKSLRAGWSSSPSSLAPPQLSTALSWQPLLFSLLSAAPLIFFSLPNNQATRLTDWLTDLLSALSADVPLPRIGLLPWVQPLAGQILVHAVSSRLSHSTAASLPAS